MLISGPTVAIAASFTAFPLRFWLHEVLGLNTRVEVADVGQFVQTLLDPKSIFAVNAWARRKRSGTLRTTSLPGKHRWKDQGR